MRRLRFWVEYVALFVFAAGIRALPRLWALRCGEWVGELAWRLRLRRGVVLDNLRTALPELTDPERLAIGRASTRNFGRATIEFMRLGRDLGVHSGFVEFEGLDGLHDALGQGRGALIVTGHLGSWAVYFSAMAHLGVPTALLIGRQSNPMVDRFMHEIPGGALQLIGKGTLAPRHVLRALKEGRAVIFAADQYNRVGTFVPFLGKPARTMTLPGSILSRDPSRPIFLMAGSHIGEGKHRVRLERISNIPADGTPEQITRRCNEALGDAILRTPDQYFWQHRRWKVVDAHPNTPGPEELQRIMDRSD